MTNVFDNAIVETMQDLYDQYDGARTLLIRVGYPRARIPAFRRADIFWSQVVAELGHGVLIDGRRTVLMAATQDFPANERLRELLHKADSPADSPASGPAGGPADTGSADGATSGAGRPPAGVGGLPSRGTGGQLRGSGTVLALLSNPVRLSTARVQDEARLFEGLRRDHGLRVEIRSAARVGDILDALRDTAPAILHFGGHGLSDGGLVFAGGRDVADGGRGKPARVDLAALSHAIGATTGTLEAVVLNSCFTGVRADAFRGVTRYVAGCADALKDDTALDFTRGFYGAITRGLDVPAAFAHGRAEVHLHGGDHTALHLVTFASGGEAP